jgi:hypothetical protein
LKPENLKERSLEKLGRVGIIILAEGDTKQHGRVQAEYVSLRLGTRVKLLQTRKKPRIFIEGENFFE